MSRNFKHSVFHWLASAALVASTASAFLATAATPAAAAPQSSGRTGVSRSVSGSVVTLADLASRAQSTKIPVDGPGKTLPYLGLNKSARGIIVANKGAGQTSSGIQPQLPQPITDTIPGPSENDEAAIQPHGFTFVPPDTMGTVGPTQLTFTENGIFRAVDKVTHNTVFNVSDVTFWGATANPAGVSDPHVRYDRRTGLWYITQIDVPNNNNDMLFAVSTGPDLTTANWITYAVPATGTGASQDQDCFADYDTPGVDQNAFYIGANIFGTLQAASAHSVGGGASPSALPCDASPGAFFHTNLYVLNKASILASVAAVNGGGSALPITFTSFYDLTNGVPSPGPWTPQPADTIDNLPSGYIVGPDLAEDSQPPFQVSHLDVLRIDNPGTTPVIGAATQILMPTPENGTVGNLTGVGVLTPNNPVRGLDDLDDRLFAAVIRNGELWTAHNLGVDITGNSNPADLTTIDRDWVRWYDINVASLTLTQSGTVSDTTSPAGTPLNYWMGTIMPSGQGHVAMGLNVASATHTLQGGAVGRLAGDAPGTMQGFTSFVDSGPYFYSDETFNPRPYSRWGDFSYTSLDPCDDMTLWTVQEFIGNNGHIRHNGQLLPVGWQVEAAKLQAPPPAVLPAALPGNLARNQTAATYTVVGTSPAGQGFYDTPASADLNCRTRLTATISNGATVTGVTYTDPTHITLTVNTSTATLGPATLTITNPDGQTVTSMITIGTPADTFGVYRTPGQFLLRNTNTTGFADIVATFNIGAQPYPVFGDWTGGGIDTIGVYDRSNGQFSLHNANTTATTPDEQFVLGNPADMPIAGKWAAADTTDGVGIFRPTNGLLLLKNTLATGFADYVMVLGIPGDVGLAHDWNGDGIDSPGVYRPSNQLFLLSNQVCNCSVFADYNAQLGNPGDSPVVGDWIGQGHSGIGVFRPTNGLILLKNQIQTGFADIVIVFGIPNDIPLAGHWSAASVAAKAPAPSILVAGPQVPTTAVPQQGNNNIGD